MDDDRPYQRIPTASVPDAPDADYEDEVQGDPDLQNPDQPSGNPDLASPRAKLLLQHAGHRESPFPDDPKKKHIACNWIWTPITDWKTPEAQAIRDEMRLYLPQGVGVKFKGGISTTSGQRGTFMHVMPTADMDLPPL